MKRPVLAVLLLVACAAAHAQLYRWTDDKGRVHITDTPPPASARDVQKRQASSAPAPAGAAATPQPAGQVPFELSAAMKEFPVVLYTSPNCAEGCAYAREHLNKRGVPFKEVQVWNEETNEELKKLSGANQVPTLVVGSSVHKGYQRSAFDALLDSARYPREGLVPARAQAAPPPPEGYVSADSLTQKAEPVAPKAEEKPALGPYSPGAPRQRPAQKPAAQK
jgi:glutaredoxin